MTAKQRFLIYLLIALLDGLLFVMIALAIGGPGVGLTVFAICAAGTLAAICWCASAEG